MATISQKEWKRYIARLREINDTAAEEFRQIIIDKGGYGNIERQKLIDYAYGISTKYGEASAALSAQMYDAIAELSGAPVPAAMPADTASYSEVAKTVNGIIKKTGSEDVLSQGVGRLVKMAGTDTILSNAYRDRPKGRGSKRRHSGAQVAWIPSGDTCPFCLMLAAKGWQNQTQWGANNHSEHIHANCDCTYAVRFDNSFKVEGYDPDEYKAMYDNADGSTRDEKLKSMRDKYREENKDKINAQKRAAYAEKNQKSIISILKPVDGNTKGTQILESAYENHRILNKTQSVPLAELNNMSIINVNYGNLSDGTVSAFNTAIESLSNQYDTPLTNIRVMTKEEALLEFKTAFASVGHDYTTDRATLIINPIKCKKSDELATRIMQLSEDGYCVKIKPEKAMEYVPTHEFAHTLINMQDELNDKTNWVGANYDAVRAARKEIESIYDKYMTEVGELTAKAKELELASMTSEDFTEMSKLGDLAVKAYDALDEVKLSDYSLNNVDEFMAESFTNEHIGIKSNKYAKEVVDVIDKYFRR